MQTHIVLVGFDYDRLIAPLVCEKMDVDRGEVLEGGVGSQTNVEYSRRLAEKLEQDYRNLLGSEIGHDERGKSHRTWLSRIGELLVRAHGDRRDRGG